MRLAEVLHQVDGLTKRFVHYLEAQGHIRPIKIEKRHIARREYGADDLHRIRAIWSYHRRGFSVQNAAELVDCVLQAQAYVLFDVPPRRWEDTLRLLRGFDNVLEASVVYGESEDIIIRLAAPDNGDIFAVLDATLRAGAISGAPRILRVARWAKGMAADPPDAACDGDEGDVQAYVLIKASAKEIEALLDSLRRLDGVVEAGVIYGESDVMCRVEVPDQKELDQLVMRDLHAIPSVESTRTFIVVTDMHWRRVSPRAGRDTD